MHGMFSIVFGRAVGLLLLLSLCGFGELARSTETERGCHQSTLSCGYYYGHKESSVQLELKVLTDNSFRFTMFLGGYTQPDSSEPVYAPFVLRIPVLKFQRDPSGMMSFENTLTPSGSLSRFSGTSLEVVTTLEDLFKAVKEVLPEFLRNVLGDTFTASFKGSTIRAMNMLDLTFSESALVDWVDKIGSILGENGLALDDLTRDLLIETFSPTMKVAALVSAEITSSTKSSSMVVSLGISAWILTSLAC